MDQLEAYKANLEKLKTKKAQVEVTLQNCVKRAGELKKQLATLGYESLDAAKEDYQRRTADLAEKAKLVDSLIKQIDAVETSIPSKDEILERLRESVKVVEVPDKKKEKDEETPLSTEAAPTESSSVGDISVDSHGAEASVEENSMFDTELFAGITDLGL